LTHDGSCSSIFLEGKVLTYIFNSYIVNFFDDSVLILFYFFNLVSWTQNTEGCSSHNSFSNESNLHIKPAALTPMTFNCLALTFFCFFSFLRFFLALFLSTFSLFSSHLDFCSTSVLCLISSLCFSLSLRLSLEGLGSCLL
jgi:hypothetical protein